ncbi:siphovirus Gp157 family protein [Peptoniphilus obesi]|uniref:siphovirus Gp157 family protein n=1 Tax=Peptoniphilus obesi TaxID=1472765 RepID=UPI0004AE14EC|nr:siphovirus Gp157 family protein [Peptoniphilus obesi]
MKLYEITEVYNNVIDLDLDEEELKKYLDLVNDEFEDKAENIAKILQSLKAEFEAYKNEAERLNTQAKSIENKIKSLKDYLEVSMIRADKRKFKTNLFNFNIQKNPPSLNVISKEDIPEEFFEIKRILKNEKLKKAIKEGQEIVGAELIQTESLRIR